MPSDHGRSEQPTDWVAGKQLFYAVINAYSRLQQAEFAAEEHGFTAVRHQREVGTSFVDAVAGGESATTEARAESERAFVSLIGRNVCSKWGVGE